MILGDLSDTKRVEALHPLLGKLFSYIKEHDFLSDPIGRIELDGDRVFINNDYPILRSQSEQVVEVHRRYLDVHVPLDAPEIVGSSGAATYDEGVKMSVTTDKDGVHQAQIQTNDKGELWLQLCDSYRRNYRSRAPTENDRRTLQKPQQSQYRYMLHR